MDRFVREAIKIGLHLNGTNTGEGFTLIRTWNPTTRLLRLSEEHRLDTIHGNKRLERHFIERGAEINRQTAIPG
jgi:hypothetical protein